MFKKLGSTATAILLAASLLAGCASSSGGESSGSEAAGEPASQTSGASEESAGGKVEVEFFNQKPEISEIIAWGIEQFQAANPDIIVKETVVADSDQVLMSRMAANDTPDTFVIWPNNSWFGMVDAGYVMDITGADFLGNVQEAALTPFLREGKNYVVPISYNTSGVFYNKDMYEENGLSIPSTWPEMLENCEKLKAAGITPFTTGAQTESHTREVTQCFLPMMPHYDAFIADANAGTLDLSKEYGPEMKRMGEILYSMVQNSQNDVIGLSYEQTFADFATGKSAMLIDGSWSFPSITAANPDINLGFFPIPGDTAEDTRACAYADDFSVSIAADTGVPDAAKAWAGFLTGEEFATYYAEHDGSISCIKSCEYTPEHMAYQAEIIASGNYKLNPDVYWTSASSTAFGAAVQTLYMSGDLDAFTAEWVDVFNTNQNE